MVWEGTLNIIWLQPSHGQECHLLDLAPDQGPIQPGLEICSLNYSVIYISNFSLLLSRISYQTSLSDCIWSKS